MRKTERAGGGRVEGEGGTREGCTFAGRDTTLARLSGERLKKWSVPKCVFKGGPDRRGILHIQKENNNLLELTPHAQQPPPQSGFSL